MKYRTRLVITVLVAMVLAASSIIPVRGAQSTALPSLSGGWTVETTCLPHCYNDPAVRGFALSEKVVLKEQRQGKVPYFYSLTSYGFSRNRVTLLPAGDHIVVLHTAYCSAQLRVLPGSLKLSGFGIMVRETHTGVFVARLRTVWTRIVPAPPGTSSSRGLTTNLRSDSHLPVGC